MFPVQDVVDGQRTDHCAGKGEVHAAVADDRHKETKEIGAEPYAEVKEDEECCGGLSEARAGNQGERYGLPHRLEVAETHAEGEAGKEQHPAVFRMGQQNEGQGRQEKDREEDDVFAVGVVQPSGYGAGGQRCQGVQQEEQACGAGKAPFGSERSHEGLHASVTQARYQCYKGKTHHTRIDIAVEAQERAMAALHRREGSQSEKDGETAQRDADVDLHQGRILHMAAQGNAEERPQSQSQRRAHAEQADAETMMLLWDHIGHDGSGSRADNPDADAGQKPLDEQQRQGIRQKEACYAGRVQQQPGAQDAPAAEKRQKVSGDETTD